MPTVSLTWALKYNDASASSGFQGVARVAPLTFIAVRKNGEVHRSTDDGNTWALLTTLPNGNFVSRVFSPATNEVYVAQANVAGGKLRLHRSTDGGATWAVVYEHTDFDGVTVNTAIQDWIRVSATVYLAIGAFENPTTGANQSAVLRSTDGGATWAIYTDIDFASSGARSYSAVRLAATGRIIVGRRWTDQAEPFGRTIKVYYSDDNGATWTISGAFPGNYPQTGAGALNKNIFALADLGGGVVLASGGFINDSDIGAVPTAQVLWVWRSTDSGATWSRIANSTIVNAPADDVAVGAFLALGSSRVLVGYGWQDQPHAAAPGWRLSLDNGATWANQPTAAAPPDGTFYSPSQMILNDAGQIISVAALDEGANGGAEIWLGTLTSTGTASVRSGVTQNVCGHPIAHTACTPAEV